MKRRRPVALAIFGVSFIDAMSCGLGALLLTGLLDARLLNLEASEAARARYVLLFAQPEGATVQCDLILPRDRGRSRGRLDALPEGESHALPHEPPGENVCADIVATSGAHAMVRARGVAPETCFLRLTLAAVQPDVAEVRVRGTFIDPVHGARSLRAAAAACMSESLLLASGITLDAADDALVVRRDALPAGTSMAGVSILVRAELPHAKPRM